MAKVSRYKGKNGITINITKITIIRGNVSFRAEGGGQILRNVGANANQGGQNAIKGSRTFNKNAQFATGNGRSGLAGKKNDELGGQESIKIKKGNRNKVKLKTKKRGG